MSTDVVRKMSGVQKMDFVRATTHASVSRKVAQNIVDACAGVPVVQEVILEKYLE